MKDSIAKIKAQAKKEAAEKVKALEAEAKKHASEPVKEPESDAMRPTRSTRKAKRTFNDADIQPGKKKGETRAPKDPASGRMTEEKLLAKYPHVIPGSLFYDEEAKKQSCRAMLACGHEATVHTSDLFQVKRCPECKKHAATKRVAELKEKAAAKKATPAKDAPAKASPKSAPKTSAPAKSAKQAPAPAEADSW